VRCPEDILALLARDADGFVRAAVAINQKTPAPILDELAGDQMTDYDYTINKNRYLVREAVARNPQIDLDALSALSSDQDEHVRSAAASNPQMPPGLLDKLSRDASWMVRDKVARNSATPEDLLNYLSADRIMDVRASVALNAGRPGSPVGAGIGQKLEVREAWLKIPVGSENPRGTISSLAWRVREAVALNPNTPMTIIEKLADDPDQSVALASRRRMAKTRPQRP